MMSRDQLTLFVEPPERGPLDELRARLDPVQHDLIAAHVTLCREDELAGLSDELIAQRLMNWRGGELRLTFGRAEVFQGHGILLPCVNGANQFHELRQQILDRRDVRHAEPHLTLAHPRNPRAAGNDLAVGDLSPAGLLLTFTRVTRIRQHGQQRWQRLSNWQLPPA